MNINISANLPTMSDKLVDELRAELNDVLYAFHAEWITTELSADKPFDYRAHREACYETQFNI